MRASYEVYSAEEQIRKLHDDLVTAEIDLKNANGYLTSSQAEVIKLREEVASLRGMGYTPVVTPINVTLPVNQEYIHSSAANVSSLIAAVKTGKKIEAIRMVRNITGMDLKEAKDLFCDAYGEPANRSD